MESLNSEFKGLEKFAVCLAEISKVLPRTKQADIQKTELKEKAKISEAKR